jgi:hypothetical protein
VWNTNAECNEKYGCTRPHETGDFHLQCSLIFEENKRTCSAFATVKEPMETQ